MANIKNGRASVPAANLTRSQDQNDSVERIASALLESPRPGQYTGLFSHLQDNSEYEIDNHVPTYTTRKPSPGSGMGRSSPPIPIPRQSSRRNLRRQHGGITKSKTGVLTPQASASARWNVLRGRNLPKIEQRIPCSKTAPLNTFALGDPHVVQSPDVAKKVEVMLAHTEALKPTKRDSRVSRMSAKVVAKASNTWGRLTGKKNPQKESIRGKISLPLELSNAQLRRASTIRMVNSNSGIVQHDRRDADDNDDQKPRTPAQSNTGAWTQILPDSVSSSDAAVSDEDPFKDGEDFTGGLDGVLTDRPLAASTPRVRRTSITALQESPLYKRSVANGEQPEVLISLSERHRTLGFRALSVQGSPALQLPRPDTMGKRHPSPSKDDLEEMSKTLQRLGIRPASPASEKDELAYSYDEGTPYRRASEQSLLGVAEERRLDIARLSNSVSRTPASLRNGSGIPGPTGSTRSGTRFGLIRIPLGPDAMDEDELA